MYPLAACRPKGGAPRSISAIQFYNACGPGDTFDPSITLKAGCPHTPVWDFGDGTQATGISVSKADYADAGPHLVTLYLPDAQNWLVGIDVNTDKISGNFLQSIAGCHALTDITAHTNPAMNGDVPNILAWPGLVIFYIGGTGVTGSVAGWVLPAGLVIFYIGGTGVTGSVAGWVLPAGLVYFYISGTGVTGSVAGWVLPAGLVHFSIYGTGVTGSVAGWVLPAGLVYFYIYGTGVTGSVAGWVLPAGLAYFYISGTAVSDTPNIASNTAMADYQYQGCSLLQANVDAILSSIYARRAAFTNAAPALNVGGTDAAPSGIYQSVTPPTTGKETVYDLVNDPTAEGFKKWAVTYTA